jgi:hypothetical protein
LFIDGCRNRGNAQLRKRSDAEIRKARRPGVGRVRCILLNL